MKSSRLEFREKDFRSPGLNKTAGGICAPAAVINGKNNQHIKSDGGTLNVRLNGFVMITNLLLFEMCGVYHVFSVIASLSLKRQVSEAISAMTKGRLLTWTERKYGAVGLGLDTGFATNARPYSTTSPARNDG